MKTLVYLSVILFLIGCDSNTFEEAQANAPLLAANAVAGEKVWDRVGCASCHGPDGQTSALGISRIIPQIGEARDIENALIALAKPGIDRDPNMTAIAENLTDQEIIDLSEFVFSLRQ